SGGEEHDEMLFIVIHQVYELWFKQLLHEVDYLGHLLDHDDLPRSLHTLKRILTILKIAVAQVDVLETMTPLEFESFRERLESASGFQSAQFRELEFVLGAKREGVVDRFPADASEHRRLLDRWHAPSLWDRFLAFLAARGEPVPEALLTRDVTGPLEPSDAVQAILLGIYRDQPELADLCERLVDLDEGLQEWRYRHVKMVERTIGSKTGTGGSAGADYLRSTLFRPLFPDLWAVRARM
ncbi:tryptophan 2,3-dioxygenase, partial [bacterium]|nr:tryptophan 2,3-dioxygenase [bacterium]